MDFSEKSRAKEPWFGRFFDLIGKKYYVELIFRRTLYSIDVTKFVSIKCSDIVYKTSTTDVTILRCHNENTSNITAYL